MATEKKRIIIYVDSDVKTDIEYVADALGCSVSRLCGDITKSALPNLRQVAEAVQMARTDPKKAAKMMKEMGGTAQADLLDALQGLPHG